MNGSRDTYRDMLTWLWYEWVTTRTEPVSVEINSDERRRNSKIINQWKNFNQERQLFRRSNKLKTKDISMLYTTILLAIIYRQCWTYHTAVRNLFHDNTAVRWELSFKFRFQRHWIYVEFILTRFVRCDNAELRLKHATHFNHSINAIQSLHCTIHMSLVL